MFVVFGLWYHVAKHFPFLARCHSFFPVSVRAQTFCLKVLLQTHAPALTFLWNRHICQVYGCAYATRPFISRQRIEIWIRSSHTESPDAWPQASPLYIPICLTNCRIFDVENKKYRQLSDPRVGCEPRRQTKCTICLAVPLSAFVSRQSFLRFDYITISIIANRPFYCPLFALQSHAQLHKTLGVGRDREMKSAHTRCHRVCLLRVFADLHGAFKYTLLFNHYCLCRRCSLIAKHTQLFPLSSDADNERV